MPLPSRALVAALALLLASLQAASPASAAITDPEMTYAAYLRSPASGAHKPRTAPNREAAQAEARLKSFCAANPRMKAMDAEMTVMGD
ncbi:hypothetical protein [Bosea sp. (in: a-proteobacteria)]|jgi:hypothetical protein|uniref:hypothetical protein n=1 Tax=Bosea sp. (in: a-proteobacteria) TaxID=1871050 RepID=UPI003F6E48D9